MTNLTSVSTFGWFSSTADLDVLTSISAVGWYELVSITTGPVIIYPLTLYIVQIVGMDLAR